MEINLTAKRGSSDRPSWVYRDWYKISPSRRSIINRYRTTLESDKQFQEHKLEKRDNNKKSYIIYSRSLVFLGGCDTSRIVSWVKLNVELWCVSCDRNTDCWFWGWNWKTGSGSGAWCRCWALPGCRWVLSILFHVERIVPIEVFSTSDTVDCVYKSASESSLIEEGVIRTQEVVSVTNRTMVVDLYRVCR